MDATIRSIEIDPREPTYVHITARNELSYLNKNSYLESKWFRFDPYIAEDPI